MYLGETLVAIFFKQFPFFLKDLASSWETYEETYHGKLKMSTNQLAVIDKDKMPPNIKHNDLEMGVMSAVNMITGYFTIMFHLKRVNLSCKE